MKNLIFIFFIIIILFKTGNVLSNNNIFNVNNIEITKKISQNREKLINQAFLKGFDKLINRLLLEADYRKLSNTNLNQIKKLISHYQIVDSNEKKNDNKLLKVNIYFDKDRIHNFFYTKNILYSDIVNTEVIFFPLLIKEKKYFIYTQNYFYENWMNDKEDNLIQYTLPVENIENIQKINKNKNNIYELNIPDFFKEHETENIVFANIEVNKSNAEIFLSTRIEGKKINKKLSINEKKNINQKEFYNKIIFAINNIVRDLIKSENLIDVRTPSFLNVKIKLNKNNLVDFNNILEKIELIDEYYVQQLNKDYVLVKIKYLGKIKKIINKLEDHNLGLKMIEGEWQLKII
tara:strand:- start:3271 stop:4314 length:1044 start_codon:yes stop_codon:yes gene_type:complete